MLPSKSDHKKSGPLLVVGIVFAFILSVIGVVAIGKMATQPVESAPTKAVGGR